MYKCTWVHDYTWELYKCTNVQMYKCTNVQMYKCTNAQMYKCLKTKLFHHQDLDPQGWVQIIYCPGKIKVGLRDTFPTQTFFCQKPKTLENQSY